MMLDRIRTHSRNSNVVVLCEQHETSEASAWLNVFRFDYLVKDANCATRLWNLVQRNYEAWAAMHSNRPGPMAAAGVTAEAGREQEGFAITLRSERSMRAYEHIILRHYLDEYKHNVQLVARKLQIGKSTIYRMLKEAEDLV